ncbi:Na+/H+ antiporter subunit E [Tessaracoccus flavus]|uniref:Na+/H+ antiporter subunit E n=2 Tax=Tessaracoccus flavus TaxID=1610493 RepID=A0A1Q2CII0_9ACTN|nr:Na+/H+ antiporter subunit E [Tessaracoccus flavus]
MRSATPWRDRLRFRPLSVFGMTLMWMLLWGSASPVIVLSGMLIGYLIDIVFPLPPIFWQGKLRPLGVVVLVFHLLWDLVVSSFRVVALVFHRRVNLNAGIVRVDLHSDNDLYQVQVAEMISLVPGTVVVEVVRSPRRLYLHVIDLVGDEPLARVQRMVFDVESRVLRAFGSDEEIAQFNEALELHPDPRATEMEVES